ncbi:hypothetical protein HZA57_08110 [Candidatus Poribacteria bacterium]|nr:hypothetical protein [Candidatus Poribacteria bacterium]
MMTGMPFLWAGSAKTPDVAPAGGLTLTLDILIFGGFLGAGIAAAAYFYFRARQGITVQQAEAQEAESRFEKEMLRNLGAGTTDARGFEGAAPLAASEAPPAVLPAFPPPVAAPVPAPAPPEPLPAQSPGPFRVDAPPRTVEELARRLTALNILADLEGRIPMPIPPDGLIYRLRRDAGLAVLLPRMESDAFMAHQAKRFDMVFVLTSTEEVLVLTRLQNQVVKLLEMPKG